MAAAQIAQHAPGGRTQPVAHAVPAPADSGGRRGQATAAEQGAECPT